MIARVFPRRTKATPDDSLAFIGDPGLFRPDVDDVHVSVTFKFDLDEGERLQKSWEDHGYTTTIGGPALGDPGTDFVPGRYLKRGYVITSRGCPNKCWFCDVWKREGSIRELPITEGFNVLDSNLLACSEKHISAVFDMLTQQKDRPVFSGGLDPSRITQDIAHELRRIKTDRLYTAYDTPDDYEDIENAGRYLKKAGFTVASHKMLCYVLIGYPKDTILDAEFRLYATVDAGFTPMAMLYRESDEQPSVEWRQFQRMWVRPTIIHGSRNLDKAD